MNAVNVLLAIQNYFEQHHNLFLRIGSIFFILFFCLYVPYNLLERQNEEFTSVIFAYENKNKELIQQINRMSREVKQLRLSYDEKIVLIREVDCLAQNMYFEAGIESKAGKLAVAEVTMNRVKSSEFPNTVCEVVYQRTKYTCQFSWVCEGPKFIYTHSIAWKDSIQIAQNILISKKKYSTIGDAKYFHATYVKPEWAARKKIVRRIGNHIFYN